MIGHPEKLVWALPEKNPTAKILQRHMNYAYTYTGLHVHSVIEIPEWTGFECVDAAVFDVHIRLESNPTDRPMPAADQPVASADEYCFSVPDIGRFRIYQGKEVVISPDPSAGWPEVRLYLLGTAWGALCYQRNLLALHLSAVRVQDGAVAFCAHPQMGKSTLAAYLTTLGHTLVSDDLTIVDNHAHGRPLIYPAARRLKLWQDAIDALDWESAEKVRDHFRYEKFHLTQPRSSDNQPLPLLAIYVLTWGDLKLTQLEGQAALHALVQAATYRGGLLEPMGKLGWYYRQCLDLVQRVPVWQFQRPRDLAQIDAAVQFLRRQWPAFADTL